MFGIFSVIIGGGILFHESNQRKSQNKKNREDAIVKGYDEYLGSNGSFYDVETSHRVMRLKDKNGDLIVKDLKTGEALRNLTQQQKIDKAIREKEYGWRIISATQDIEGKEYKGENGFYTNYNPKVDWDWLKQRYVVRSEVEIKGGILGNFFETCHPILITDPTLTELYGMCEYKIKKGRSEKESFSVLKHIIKGEIIPQKRYVSFDYEMGITCRDCWKSPDWNCRGRYDFYEDE